MSNKIAYDLDGTLDVSCWGVWSHDPKHARRLNSNINPNRVKFVVTGRFETVREMTMAHLAEMGIRPLMLLMNPSRTYDAEYLFRMKSQYLDWIDAAVYVDDDPLVQINLPKYWDGIVIGSEQLGAYI